MRNLIKKILILIIFLLSSIQTFAISENEKLVEQDSSKTLIKSLIIEVQPDTFHFKLPNLILKFLGYHPIRIDSISLSNSIDSIHPEIEPRGYRLELKDSTKVFCILENDDVEGIRSKKGRAITIKFFKADSSESKTIYLKASTYGNLAYFILILLILLVISIFIFRRTICPKFKKLFYIIYRIPLSLFKRKEKPQELSIVKPGALLDQEADTLLREKSIANIQKEIARISNAISEGHRDILNRIEKLTSETKKAEIDKRIKEKEDEIKRLSNELINTNQIRKQLEDEIQKMKSFQEMKLKELNEKINEITKEKNDSHEKYQKLQKDYDILKSLQNELSSSSIKIISVDKKKLERYGDLFKIIIKMNHAVQRVIFNSSFSNANLLTSLNKIIINYFFSNLEDVFEFNFNNENIITFQRTDNNKIRDKFPEKLTVGFDEFDQKYREIIFDNCISGKVDKLLIGMQLIYALKYQIKLSTDDLYNYEKMCDQLKGLENELVMNLNLGGYEPFPISLFEELNVQKTSFIENIGGLSLTERFPLYEKKPDQKDLILDIAQWAYKKDGGLWKNRKALVKISI